MTLTPGRISTVFFFPEASYELLCDKEAGWGPQTNYGRWTQRIKNRGESSKEQKKDYRKKPYGEKKEKKHL
jgi:hypothetical protein